MYRAQEKNFEDGIYKIEEHSEPDEFPEDSFFQQTEIEQPRAEASRSKRNFDRTNEIHVVAEIHTNDPLIESDVQVPDVFQCYTVF